MCFRDLGEAWENGLSAFLAAEDWRERTAA
jgi:hypothetical protein